MRFLKSKEKAIIRKIESYFRQLRIAREDFQQCMHHLIRAPLDERNHSLVEAVHKSESLADDYRRDIEFDLYNKSLLPKLREDILELIELLDRIPGSFQSVVFQLSLQQIEIPPPLQEHFEELIGFNLQAYALIQEALDGFFSRKNILPLLTAIDDVESNSDRREYTLIKRIFDLEIDKADKILLREIVSGIGHISDLAQSAADKLNLTIVKHRI